MTTVTIEQVKVEQAKLADMIAKLEAQAKRTITMPAAEIKLNEGEHYAGIILGKDGAASYHLILLPGQSDDINWANAKDWAAEAGGELPTRREQALLYANLKEQFEERYYWSSEAHASDSVFAWCQHFSYGSQDCYDVLIKLRARAVRRLEIL